MFIKFTKTEVPKVFSCGAMKILVLSCALMSYGLAQAQDGKYVQTYTSDYGDCNKCYMVIKKETKDIISLEINNNSLRGSAYFDEKSKTYLGHAQFVGVPGWENEIMKIKLSVNTDGASMDLNPLSSKSPWVVRYKKLN